jgi:hypothetical protein
MMFSLAVACELTAFKSNYTRLNTVISSSKALEGVPLWRCSVTSALSSSSGPSLDKITSGFWSFSERLVVSSKTEMYFPQVGLHAIISSERTCKKEHTYQLQVGFAAVNKTRPEHDGSTQLPCFTTMLSNTMAITNLDLGWITADQASLVTR